jgi:polyvinyl alcohol dehydrogenase (cytochrome)
MCEGFQLRRVAVACFLGCAVVGLVSAPAALASAGSRDPHSPDPGGAPPWTVYHDGPAGRGVATGVGSVDTSARAWTSPTLNGQLYGEPLVLGDLVYVATENDAVYALSAATGAIVWSVLLGTTVPAKVLPCSNIDPNVGITGTPVIDPARHEIFLVADEMRNGTPAHMLTGLNTSTGEVELSQDVDPPGQAPAAQLQRTGLTLDDGNVYFGYGGNAEDCGSYHGRLVSVPESGGTPHFFSTTTSRGDNAGAVWMGGGAPSVGPNGDLWVETGNSTADSTKRPYDESDGVLEISPSLHLVQYFAPAIWAVDNSDDLDMSAEPVLLPDGQVIAAGKSQVVYLLSGSHLGIGQQQAELKNVCGSNIDGGSADDGMTVYLPCLSGIIAVRATSSPPTLRLLWTTNAGGGPPIVAGGLVWSVAQAGGLYGLDPATGAIRQQAATGTIANHFPTPGVGAGLMLVPAAQNVIAFRTSATAVGQGGGTPYTSLAPDSGGRMITQVVLGSLAAVGLLGWFVWLVRRTRRP